MPIPLSGDRSAFRVTEYGELHGDDIANGQFIHHLPQPGYPGAIPFDTGTEWVGSVPTSGSLGDMITSGSQAENDALLWDMLTGKWTRRQIPLWPAQALFTYSGPIAVVTGELRIYNEMDYAKRIIRVTLGIGTAPTPSQVIVDIHKNGTTIFTNQANRPVLAVDANRGFTTAIDVPLWQAGEYLTMDVDQIGGSTPGSNLTVHVTYVQTSWG